MLFGQKTILNNTNRTFNDTTVLALILAEHQKLTVENPLLKEEIQLLKQQNKLCEEQDSLHQQEIGIYKEELIKTTNKLNKSESSRKKIITFSSVGGILLFIIGILL